MYKITNESEAGHIIVESLTEARKLADLTYEQVSKVFQGRIVRNGGIVVRKI